MICKLGFMILYLGFRIRDSGFGDSEGLGFRIGRFGFGGFWDSGLGIQD